VHPSNMQSAGVWCSARGGMSFGAGWHPASLMGEGTSPTVTRAGTATVAGAGTGAGEGQGQGQGRGRGRRGAGVRGAHHGGLQDPLLNVHPQCPALFVKSTSAGDADAGAAPVHPVHTAPRALPVCWQGTGGHRGVWTGVWRGCPLPWKPPSGQHTPLALYSTDTRVPCTVQYGFPVQYRCTPLQQYREPLPLCTGHAWLLKEGPKGPQSLKDCTPLPPWNACRRLQLLCGEPRAPAWNSWRSC